MKAMNEMSNRELFCVLTGEKGIMAQLQLQNVIRKCRACGMDKNTDLHTMVVDYLDGKYEN